MVLGDRIRRNIASVEPSERELLCSAMLQLNDQNHIFRGSRSDNPAGAVTWWFKQDEIHQATHVHEGPEFIPWHREIVNRLEAMLRTINPDLSLHYWDWTQDPTRIPDGNLGNGVTGLLNLFTSNLMGHGGTNTAPIGEPWLSAGYYVPGANPDRDKTDNNGNRIGTAADPPIVVRRRVRAPPPPATVAEDNEVLDASDFADMRRLVESIHNDMHTFVRMGSPHISFRDPFVFLLHSNVDRLFARWQTDPAHPERLNPDTVYGSESNLDVPVHNIIQNVNHLVEPWSTGHSFDQFGNEHFTRPWSALGEEVDDAFIPKPHTYKDPSIVTPPRYDTNHNNVSTNSSQV